MTQKHLNNKYDHSPLNFFEVVDFSPFPKLKGHWFIERLSLRVHSLHFCSVLVIDCS